MNKPRQADASGETGTVQGENLFDVVVIGGGPGGYAAALRTSQNGLKTALVERENRLGGTCLLRGCIPTKALLETARRLEEAKKASDFGVELFSGGVPSVDMAKVVRRKERLIGRLATGISGLCKRANVEVVCGTASFDAKDAIRVTSSEGSERILRAQNVIIATGSVVRDLPNLPRDGRYILNSDDALELQRVPESLLVLGSGAVGLEFASAFRALGSKVTVVETMSRILPLADEDVSAELARAFRRRKIGLCTTSTLETVQVAEGKVRCTIKTMGEVVQHQELEVDGVLVAVGRQANVASLGLEKAGIQLSSRGFIPVSEEMETAMKGIYAIGDLVDSPALAHVATREGLIAADAMSGRSTAHLRGEVVPSAVYSMPEAAFVGLTQRDAESQFGEVTVAQFPFVAMGRAVVSGETEGMVKLVADKASGRIVGAHMVGPHATELLGELTSTVSSGDTLQDVAKRIHAHPTLSEIIGEAAWGGLSHPQST